LRFIIQKLKRRRERKEYGGRRKGKARKVLWIIRRQKDGGGEDRERISKTVLKGFSTADVDDEDGQE
jgi:hypothetical protein